MEMVLYFDLNLTRIPFSTQNPIGYLMGFILQYTMALYIYRVDACGMSYGAGVTPFLFSAIGEIKDIISSIGEMIKSKRNRSQSFKPVSNFIHFHSELIQLSDYRTSNLLKKGSLLFF